MMTIRQPQEIDSYNVLLGVMSDVFILIRATDNIKKANILSDVFHNVPAGIASHCKAEEIEKAIYERAARLECERQVDALFESVRGRISPVTP